MAGSMLAGFAATGLRHGGGLAFLRQYMLSEEELRPYRWHIPWRGEYQFFRSENVVCIEHFRRPHTLGQKAGRFGWTKV